MATTSGPCVGDLVHVTGSGPATVISCVGGGAGYEVRCPNGGTSYIEQDSILAHQAVRGVSLAPSTAPQHLEYLGRAFDDPNRNLHTPAATFALIASTIGGSVLSLPYAMSQCGFVLGIGMFLVTAVVSGWTLDMLVECARCTGRNTYELVGLVAFGERARKLTILLVFLTTWMVQVAFLVLMQDLLSPIVEHMLPSVAESLGGQQLRMVVVCSAIVLLAPMCYKSGLAALRMLCVASVASVVLVTLILGFRAASTIGTARDVLFVDPEGATHTINIVPQLPLWAESFTQALYVFPVIGISFQCHFNALPTHTELQRPTQQRMRRIISLSVVSTAVLYTCMGVFGLAWAGEAVCGNILLNFASDDKLIIFCRACLGLMLLMNFPMFMQPSRNALWRLVSDVGGPSSPSARETFGAAIEMSPQSFGDGASKLPPECSKVLDEELMPGALSEGTPSSLETGKTSSRQPPALVHAYRLEDTSGWIQDGAQVELADAFEARGDTSYEESAEPSKVQNFVMTTAILASCLVLSMVFQSIVVVFSVIGSSMATMLVFVLPAAFWLKLVGPRTRVRKHFVGAVLCLFVFLTVACNVLSVQNLSSPACPFSSNIPTIREASSEKPFPAIQG